jgi:formylglycine-generating enzyme required for sulfatase activity
LDNSYCQISYANGSFSVDSGKADYPCVEITWYGAMAYCKYKNEMEGKEQTINLTDWSIDWSKNGYRLPTEAEWEKAARGGAAGHRFPWSDTDTITHSSANYYSYWEGGSPYFPYDVNPTEGYHPDYFTGTFPYTSPAGSFAPNGYGLYDMAGNVWEWCWDWYGSGYYSSSPVSNPRGPASGTVRVLRGGSWYSGAGNTRCAGRGFGTPDGCGSNYGFRCVFP